MGARRLVDLGGAAERSGMDHAEVVEGSATGPWRTLLVVAALLPASSARGDELTATRAQPLVEVSHTVDIRIALGAPISTAVSAIMSVVRALAALASR
jgi:hypothetical protein